MQRAGGTWAERLWSLLFSIAGRLEHPVADAWYSSGGERVLALAPHPDDEVVGCAGVLALHCRAGDEVMVACVTDGRRSRALDLGAEEMAAQRRTEAVAAARALGPVRLTWLGLRESEWSVEDLTPRLQQLVTTFDPRIIYAPSRIDFHPEHHDVARSLAGALAGPPCEPTIRIYQTQVPLTPLTTNLVADVSAVSAEIDAAFAAYATQRRSIDRSRRARRYAAHRYRIGRSAEAFWQLSIRQYTLLHQHDGQQWNAFTGLREHPVHDVSAYMSRWRERRALRRLVSDQRRRE